MSQTASVWLVIVAALVAANLPFISTASCWPVWPLRASKPPGLRLLELVAFYFLTAASAWLLENRPGPDRAAEAGSSTPPHRRAVPDARLPRLRLALSRTSAAMDA
jgi:hypothetical protein